MRKRVGVWGRDYDLLSPGDNPGDGHVLRFRDHEEALLFLRGMVSDPLALADIRHQVFRVRDGGGTVALSDKDVLTHAARLLATERLRITTVHVDGGGGGSAEAGSATEARQPEPEPRRSFGPSVTPSQLTGRTRDEAPPISESGPPSIAPVLHSTSHWIEIELLGEDNEPIPDIRYLLNLPDGRELTGRLDGKGFARVDGILQPGTCGVCFPDLDEDAWELIDSLGSR